jgi:EAL domain-containing protein (putative c-di-GMP-specific phosphodiesterase class I)
MLGKQIRDYGKNEIILREGDTGDWAYLIESGQVLVFVTKDGEEVPLKILGKGEIFGEMSMIDNSVRSASCRTLTEVRLVAVTQEQLLDRIQAADPVVRLLMRAFLDRLREQNDAVRGRTMSGAVVSPERLASDQREALDRINLENKIAIAIDGDEFVPHYQPIYDLGNQRVVGCEALLRWKTADGKLIAPGTFIDALENSPLILDVGRIMLEKCIADLVRLRGSVPGGLSESFFVSVNVSGRQFADPHFIDRLETIRAASGVPSGQIKLEVTERIMTEGPLAISTLQNCRALGYKIAIDDFGTGFSSLQYLAAMPLHDLKVDRSFVNQMMQNEKALSIVKTLIHRQAPQPQSHRRGRGNQGAALPAAQSRRAYGPGLPVRQADVVRRVPRAPRRGGRAEAGRVSALCVLPQNFVLSSTKPARDRRLWVTIRSFLGR